MNNILLHRHHIIKQLMMKWRIFFFDLTKQRKHACIIVIIMACTTCCHICTSMLLGNTQLSPASLVALARAPACMGCTSHILTCTEAAMTQAHSKTSLPCWKKPPCPPHNDIFFSSPNPTTHNYPIISTHKILHSISKMWKTHLVYRDYMCTSTTNGLTCAPTTT